MSKHAAPLNGVERIERHTPDLTEENVSRLIELFPNVATEVTDPQTGETKRAVDFDVLRENLGDVAEGPRERYQFTWPGKRAAKAEARKSISKTLRPVPERSKNWDDTQNLYIEGDNLDALKILRETYAGKIKMIYIDPPYNTGHDFVYDDDFSQSREEYDAESGDYDENGGRLVANTESNGRFHSDWCSMIYPRLLLARDLLTSDGVIFISLDDGEQINASKICDEIFGAANRIGPIIQNKQNAKNDAINVQKNHEYLLVYRKMPLFAGATVKPTLLRKTDRYRNAYKSKGRCYYLNDPITTRGEGGTLNARPNLGHTIYFNPVKNDLRAVADYDIELAKTSNNEEDVYRNDEALLSAGYVPIRPPKVRGKLGCWTWSLEKVNEDKDNLVVTGKPGSYSVRKRTFVPESECEVIDGKLRFRSQETANTRSIIDYSTNEGTNELTQLMCVAGLFDNPKNVEMLKYLISLIPADNYTALDFFSGSATTAHAVMQLNAEDGGNRKFIMVQLPEETAENSEASKAGYSTICEIGEERIRRAGEKIKAEVEKSNEQLELGASPKKVPDIGFRVLRVDSSNYEDAYRSVNEVTQAGIDDLIDVSKADRSKLDRLFECLPSFQLPYSSTVDTLEGGEFAGHTVYSVNGGQLVACFDSEIPESLIRAVAGLEPRPSYAVFGEGGLKNSATITNVTEIFKQSANGTTGSTKIRII